MDLPCSPSQIDLGCAWLMAAVGVTLCAAYVVAGERVPIAATASTRASRARDAASWALGPIVRGLVAAGVSPATITLVSLLAGIAAGLLLAGGHFGAASVLAFASSLGDALDGMVARESHSASDGGALLDASVDRYEEFFALGGLAVHFHASLPRLELTLGALLASVMVSYGSAKAEALHVPVPPGPMRRPQRAICLVAGCALVPLCSATGGRSGGSLSDLPLVVSLAVIALVGNISAITRLRMIARAVARRPRAAELVCAPAVTDRAA